MDNRHGLVDEVKGLLETMDSRHVLVAEVKGLLKAIEIESKNIRWQLAFDNVYDVHSLDKIKLYLDAVTTKMTKKTDEILTEDDLFKE